MILRVKILKKMHKRAQRVKQLKSDQIPNLQKKNQLSTSKPPFADSRRLSPTTVEFRRFYRLHNLGVKFCAPIFLDPQPVRSHAVLSLHLHWYLALVDTIAAFCTSTPNLQTVVILCTSFCTSFSKWFILLVT